MKLRLPLDFLGVDAESFGLEKIRDQTTMGVVAWKARNFEQDIIDHVAYPPQGSSIAIQVVPKVKDGMVRLYAVPVYTFNPADGRHISYIYAMLSAYAKREGDACPQPKPGPISS